MLVLSAFLVPQMLVFMRVSGAANAGFMCVSDAANVDFMHVCLQVPQMLVFICM
jgi:hypothetical protein